MKQAIRQIPEDENGIIRVVKDEKWFAASNEPFNDKRLTWETRGLIAYLLSKPNNWTTRIADLVKRGPAKAHKLRRMLKEAIRYRYMVRLRIQGEDNTFSWATQLYESPELNPYLGNDSFIKVKLSTSRKSTTGENSGEKPVGDFPQVEDPVTGSPTSGKPRDIVITEDLVITDLQNTETPSSPITDAGEKGEGEGDSVFSENQTAIKLFIEKLDLLFPPAQYGHLNFRPAFLECDSDNVLGWIAKAYQDRDGLTRGGGPIGLIVARLSENAPADDYYLREYLSILPDEYLEAVGLLEFECNHCEFISKTNSDVQEHKRECHPFVCMECGQPP